MNQIYSYEECYTILNIAPGCSWPELRRHYKSLIQKWHPDRYIDDSNEKRNADVRIKEINLAYQQLEDYYQEQGTLPPCTYRKTEENLQDSTYSSPRAPGHNYTRDKAHQSSTEAQFSNNAPQTSYRSVIRTWGIVVSVATIYIVLLIVENSNNDKVRTKSAFPSQTESRTYMRSAQQPATTAFATHLPYNADSSLIDDKTFFTHNSTMGEVINIQGEPDLVINNTWYYGKSEVYFLDGHVVGWKRVPGSPLNAKINQLKEKNN